MEVLALIPARSGSKTIIDKNIQPLNDKPLLAYSIQQALQSKLINRVVVSTDSEKYAKIAKSFGAEVPFLRPKELGGDFVRDFEVFYHALTQLREMQSYTPDIVVHLRPTYPMRNVDDIDKMIELILHNEELDSIRSIAKSKEIPFKMWIRDERGLLQPISPMKDCFNMPRQELPEAYYQNACIDVIRSSVILEQKTMAGNRIYGYIMEDNFDIDVGSELAIARDYFEILAGKKTFCFDIDGVIALFDDRLEYDKSKPNKEMIARVNKLYEYGNTIILFTARGSKSGIDWQEVTRKQIESWGVKYHKLLFGKPAADFYIDDKSMSLGLLTSFQFN